MAIHQRWLPGTEASTENMGMALFLEDEHWRRAEIAVANGIATALNG